MDRPLHPILHRSPALAPSAVEPRFADLANMVRYYTEELDCHIDHLIVQDDKGVYTAKQIRPNTVGVLCIRSARPFLIKLPEWEDCREVDTTSREYLEFIRWWERGPYTVTRPSEIREAEGTIEEVVRKVWPGQSDVVFL